MSLLLDALKKAADEKQKAARAEAGNGESGDSGQTAETDKAQPPATTEEELSLDPLPEEPPLPPQKSEQESAQAQPPAGEEAPGNGDSPPEKRTARPAGEEIQASVFTGGASPERTAPELALADSDEAQGISDEALALLIRKTNNHVQRDRHLRIASLALLILLVIVSAGTFYYLDTQEEIASLERRHLIAMQQMKAKTGGDNAPQSSAIIRNLVSDESLENKVQFAKSQMAKAKTGNTSPAMEKDGQGAAVAGSKAASTQSVAEPDAGNNSVLSIHRSQKLDPVSEWLQRAWQAYDAGDYAAAKYDYQQVIAQETDNRDALLGLAVIAQRQQDAAVARQYYRRLLQLDPRDAHAIAGLSSLQSAADSEEHEGYLLAQLQKNPEAAALNFALAGLYARQQQWQQAQAYYFRAWQSDSGNPDYVYNLAVSLDRLGKSRQAIQFYRHSLQLAASRRAGKAVGFSTQAVLKRIQELEQE